MVSLPQMKAPLSLPRFGIALGLSLTFSLLPQTLPAQAAPNLAAIQAQIRSLQEQAAAAGEAAQQAQVQLNTLNHTLASVQQAASQEAVTVNSLKKSLGAIALEQYKSGGLSQSMELLFSSNPSLYLSSAGSLESVTRKKAIQLRKYSVAKQRLNATSMTVNDKVALVKAAQRQYVAQQNSAKAKLAEAQKLFSKLSKAERKRLQDLINNQENSDQKSSTALALKANLGSGRGAIALRFSIKQIGDRYVFGAAGPTYWDCSGLTMRGFQSAGVSLPHSAAAQYGYGKFVPFNKLRAGDLVFFGHPISHVGIYLGGGRMVHAPHPGARVKVASFGYRFGNLSYVGARRI